MVSLYISIISIKPEWKYHFFSERANTYIPKFIDAEWESFWPDPPFPAFPSGHAIQAAAAATVLEDTFGEQFVFTDRAHEGRDSPMFVEESHSLIRGQFTSGGGIDGGS